MTIWIDAQLSPALALWINENFEGIGARSVWTLKDTFRNSHYFSFFKISFKPFPLAVRRYF